MDTSITVLVDTSCSGNDESVILSESVYVACFPCVPSKRWLHKVARLRDKLSEHARRLLGACSACACVQPYRHDGDDGGFRTLEAVNNNVLTCEITFA